MLLLLGGEGGEGFRSGNTSGRLSSVFSLFRASISIIDHSSSIIIHQSGFLSISLSGNHFPSHNISPGI